MRALFVKILSNLTRIMEIYQKIVHNETKIVFFFIEK